MSSKLTLFKNKFALTVLGLGAALIVYNTFQFKTIRITGRTMGTTYSVTIITRGWQQADAIKADIEEELERYNQVFSTYISDSEISRFNSVTPNSEVSVSKEFLNLTQRAKQWALDTNYAFDPTIKPLLDLWPFSPDMREFKFPKKEQIHATLLDIGFGEIKMGKSGGLIRGNSTVSIDYSAIAKGDGVDKLVALLDKKGYQHFLVEIGGEIFARGRKPDGSKWKVGVNTPTPGSRLDDVVKVVDLENQGMATSGDYRNFISINGKSFSHIIDPQTGYPVQNDVVSVTVIASSTAKADALATGLMVLGPSERWMSMANTKVLFAIKENGLLKFIESDNWQQK